jgi:hypothetical protein
MRTAVLPTLLTDVDACGRQHDNSAISNSVSGNNLLLKD